MLEGFKTVKLESALRTDPRVTLKDDKLYINSAALKVINKNTFFDIGINTKDRQICLIEAKSKSPHSISGKCKGIKYISNRNFIKLISKFIKGYDSTKRYNLPLEVRDNALVVSVGNAEVMS